jgi:sugar-specific transcriptional regulator TrmB
MSFDQETLVLEKLGLTSSQATVYLAMFSLDNPTARMLFRNLSIARQDIYRILSELEERGLVERILAKPTRFRPTPIKNALSILLDRKYNEAAELKKQANELFSSSEEWTKAKTKMLPEESFEVRRVYVNDPRVKASLASVRNEVRLLEGKIDWAVFGSFVGDMESLLEKGLKFKLITETATKQQKMPEFMDALRKNPCFEMRFLPALFPTKIILYDNREVAIWLESTSKLHDLKKPRALWSTNPGLVELSSNYFEVHWNNATQYH